MFLIARCWPVGYFFYLWCCVYSGFRSYWCVFALSSPCSRHLVELLCVPESHTRNRMQTPKISWASAEILNVIQVVLIVTTTWNAWRNMLREFRLHFSVWEQSLVAYYSEHSNYISVRRILAYGDTVQCGRSLTAFQRNAWRHAYWVSACEVTPSHTARWRSLRRQRPDSFCSAPWRAHFMSTSLLCAWLPGAVRVACGVFPLSLVKNYYPICLVEKASVGNESAAFQYLSISLFVCFVLLVVLLFHHSPSFLYFLSFLLRFCSATTRQTLWEYFASTDSCLSLSPRGPTVNPMLASYQDVCRPQRPLRLITK
jgi:hypothetical protein